MNPINTKIIPYTVVSDSAVDNITDTPKEREETVSAHVIKIRHDAAKWLYSSLFDE
jgi:hypothetical protein